MKSEGRRFATKKNRLHTIASQSSTMIFVTVMHTFETLTLGKEHIHKRLSVFTNSLIRPMVGKDIR